MRNTGAVGVYGGFMVKIRVSVEKSRFFWKIGFSWDFGQEFEENKERAGDLMIYGKSEKIGKSKELKRPALNVDKILNFRRKGPGRGRIGFLMVLWGSGRVFDGFMGVG